MTRRTIRPPRRAAALLAPLAAGLLFACATPTPYQPLGARGTGASGGYASQQIEQNRFRVSFTGNRLTSRERVENYLLFRAAELTVQQGYDGFTVVRRDTDRDVDTRVRRDPFGPGPYGYWAPYWSWYGPYGWNAWDPWIGRPFFTSTVDIDTIERYQAMAEIVMFRGSRPDDPMSFDARQVMANLGPGIELPG
jgi:hypothetical protein